MSSRTRPPRGAVLARAELRAAGVHPRRLASSEFTDVFSGHVTPSSDPAPLFDIADVLVRARLPGALLSHTTAAELCDLPLPDHARYATGGTLHVTAPAADRRRAGPQVTTHRLSNPGQTAREPLPIVGMPALLCGLATMLSTEEMVLVLDHLMGPAAQHRRRSREEIWRFASIGAPMPGKARLRQALWRARPDVPSGIHTRIRRFFHLAGVPPPVENLSLATDIPGISVMVDFAYPESRIGILWTDSSNSPRSRREARLREADLLQLGWIVLHLSLADLDDPQGFVAVFRAASRTRRATA